MMLLKYGNYSAAMRKAFVVYLISHDRPIIEVLNPGLGDIWPVFETEFQGMTLEAVTCEDLEKTREELVSMIAGELTIDEKQFIVSISYLLNGLILLGFRSLIFGNYSFRQPVLG